MKLDWGDEVIVIEKAPDKYRPGKIGAIVGFTEVNNDYLQKEYEVPFGTLMCTVEFYDGTDKEIPVEFLLKYDIK